MKHSFFALGLLLTFTACGPADAPDSAAPDTLSAPASSADNERAEVPIALDSDGLRFVDPASGSTRLLEFGADQDRAVTAVANARGSSIDRGVNEECGAGPLAFEMWADGLTLWFSDGSFDGWIVDGRETGADNYTTINGIGIGSSRAALADAYDIEVEETTLGTEFFRIPSPSLRQACSPTGSLSPRSYRVDG